MELGAKFITRNPVIADAFRKALDFWKTQLDLNWHEVNDYRFCAIEVMDGNHSFDQQGHRLLPPAVVARSQFPEWGTFEGHIAVNPFAPLTNLEWYLTAVHEIGHMLGLKHNPDAKSVMYYLDLEGTESLTKEDLVALNSMHKLRVQTFDPVKIRVPPEKTDARTTWRTKEAGRSISAANKNHSVP
jgi:hypothetical protein